MLVSYLLTNMKHFTLIIGLFLFVAVATAGKVSNEFYDEYAELLQKYVKANGVAYADWAAKDADVVALDSLLAEWAEIDVAALCQPSQKAFYINLYNAAMLQAVLDHYPLKSVKDIGLIPFSIFKKDFIEQGGRELSLDDVEKGILLKEHGDPRIHFAVNCASESCPPLRAEPFIAAMLEVQLDEQTHLFANSERAARKVGKRYAYSELFNWYDSDFQGKHPAEYLNRYRVESLPTDEKFDWISYDWSLNSAQ